MRYIYEGPDSNRLDTRIYRKGSKLLAIDHNGNDVIERVNESRLREVLTSSGLMPDVPAFDPVPAI